MADGSRNRVSPCDCFLKNPVHVALVEGKYELAERLLANGWNVNGTVGGFTLLQIACKSGSLRQVKFLVKCRADLNSIGVDGTALHLACRWGHPHIVRYLLNEGANVNCEDGNETPVHYAVRTGQFELLKLLSNTESFDVNRTDRKGNSILKLAVEIRAVEIVEYILEFQPCTETVSNREAFYLALRSTGEVYQSIINTFTRYGLKVNSKDAKNDELLHTVIEKGYYELVKGLLKLGADPNCSNPNNKMPPLHMALLYQFDNIVKLLLAWKADVNGVCVNGTTPLIYAAGLPYVRGVELLLKHGADISMKNPAGHTAFHAAISSDIHHESMIHLLLEYGSDVNTRCNRGRTPLSEMVSIGAEKAVKTLLEFGAKFDREDLNEIIEISAEWYVSGLRLHLDNGFANAVRSMSLEERDPSDFIQYARRIGHRNVTANVLANHIIKLEAASPFGDERKFPFTFDNTFDTFKVKCENEVSRLKGNKIGSSRVTFYDFMIGDIKALVKYLRQDDIRVTLTSARYKKLFPIYSGVIHRQFRKGTIRKSLLEFSLSHFQVFFANSPDLPREIKEMLIEYFDDKDLRTFISISRRVREKKERTQRSSDDSRASKE